MQSLLILGRQPAIGLAELESLYGSAVMRTIGKQAVLLDIDPCLLAFDRLGGSLKFCKVLTRLETTNWSQIEKFLIKVSPGHSQTMSAGKLLLGLSAYDLAVTPAKLEATGLSLKKAIRKTGRPVRLIPNKARELNSAQVLHNHLTGSNGWELVFVRDDSATIIAQTVKIQNIEAYSNRDRQRPKRDSKVGMLPPKLAQIIINLAAGQLSTKQLSSICGTPAGEPIPLSLLDKNLLDPFCGTGVLLQEALLMGYSVTGTDMEARMINYSQRNLEWLGKYYTIAANRYALSAADATTYKWPQPINMVASETYLGRSFTNRPSPEVLVQTISDCNLILKKFLRNIHSQLLGNARLCLAVPAWPTGRGQFRHLPFLDSLEEIGYNRVSFEHAKNGDIIYHRPDQFVARELLVLTKQ